MPASAPAGRPLNGDQDATLHPRRTAAAGFTLVELAISLAIAATLMGLAVPSFARLVAEHRLGNEARRLSDAIFHARSEALKRNAPVVICASVPADPCGPTRLWHEGWLMFADGDADGTPDPGEPSIGHDGPAASGVTMTGNRPVARLPPVRLDRSCPHGLGCAADGHVGGLPSRSCRLSCGARQFGAHPHRTHAGNLPLTTRGPRRFSPHGTSLSGPAAACSCRPPFDRLSIVAQGLVP